MSITVTVRENESDVPYTFTDSARNLALATRDDALRRGELAGLADTGSRAPNG